MGADLSLKKGIIYCDQLIVSGKILVRIRAIIANAISAIVASSPNPSARRLRFGGPPRINSGESDKRKLREKSPSRSSATL